MVQRSKSTALNVQLRNMARGGKNCRHLRFRVFNAIVALQRDKLESLPPFLASSFFSLLAQGTRGSPGDPVVALPLQSRDWDILKRLILDNSETFSANYLRLVTDYISTNRVAVQRIYETEQIISRAVLNLDGPTVASSFDAMPQADRQSLFAFKLYCASNAEHHRNITAYFAHNRHSTWVQQRLLYPLMFKFINLPDDSSFEQLLAQVIPDLGRHEVERKALTLLLLDEQLENTLAFKLYLALLCHPFDALEIVTGHFERLIASAERLPTDQRSMLAEIRDATGSSRLSTLLALEERQPPAFVESPTDLPVCSRLDLDSCTSHLLATFISWPELEPFSSVEADGLQGPLARLRFRKYPLEADFTAVVHFSRRYGFCEVGRLLTVLLTSTYMVERRSSIQERVHIVRQLDYWGSACTFLACSPRAAEVIASGVLGSSSEVEAAVDQSVMNAASVQTRWWIKIFHWRLRHFEREMRVGHWLREVRKSVPLSNNARFLSGIDWSWIDQVIRVLRIKPFSGNPDGIYVLLLRAIEQRLREPNALRLALTPLVPPGSRLSEFVEGLRAEFGPHLIAMIRFFLTPAMILKMRLEPNYTAALSGRLDVLESTVAEFGFDDDIITPEQYSNEQRALTTALTFMTVGAAQFEISWEAFRTDAENNCEDEYKMFLALAKTYNSLPLLSNAVRQFAHHFSNKEVREYEFRNRDWPLALTILSVVDTFLAHPSYGIEAILAIRIRHDNLRREFAVELADLRRTIIPGVSHRDKANFLLVVEPALNAALQEWIDRYMHTGRGGPGGLFDFVPSQSELEGLIGAVATTSDPTKVDIIVPTMQWLRSRLEERLEVARTKLEEELTPSLLIALERAQQQVVATGTIAEGSASRIAAVVSASIKRRANDLCEWFKTPAEDRRRSLNLREIKFAVEGRFDEEVRTGRLQMRLIAPNTADVAVAPEHLRSMFDLWSELTMNALKHCGKDTVRVRAEEVLLSGTPGLRFSTFCAPGDATTYSIEAQPHAADDPMLKAGNSGLRKVAALSAAMRGEAVHVGIVRKHSSFHVIVPLPNDLRRD